MRGGRQTHHIEEEESAFISMTDMTVSFLFIIMILLAFFATQIPPRNAVSREKYDQLRKELSERDRQITSLQSVKEDSNPIERYNYQIAELRHQLLWRLKNDIKETDPSIEVEISRNQESLEFKGDGLFPSASDVPTAVGRHKMEVIASVLKKNLDCFALSDNTAPKLSCNPSIGLIDSLQVEGHTDSSGPDTMNMDLSSRRGSSIYAIMATTAPEILGLRNLRGQPILSVAGYGEGRPIARNDTVQGRDANRRIDLRFIMFSPLEEKFVPRTLNDLPRLEQLLTRGSAP